MDSFLALLGFEDQPWLEPALVGAIFLASLLLAAIFHKLLFPLILRLSQRTPTDLDSRALRATRLPLTLGITVLGAYLALDLPLELGIRAHDALDTVAGVLGVLLGIVAVSAVVSQIFDWYIESPSFKAMPRVSFRLMPLLRRLSTAVIYGLGGLLVLDLLTVNINPLVASLGLGGLAVALAIQPTLANLFAGTYVMTEGVISPGDYIELEGGTAGYVVEVGWRSTRIRTWGNNLVVVPNGKFAETIITNYNEPLAAVNVYLTCGVSYDSDLDEVERVALDVMREELETNPNAVTDYGAWFAFDSFGDSNVNFWLFVQARDRLGSFYLQSGLIKRLHRRFKDLDIVINYPMRTLRFPNGLGPDALAGLNGDGLGRRRGRRVRRRDTPRLRALSIAARTRGGEGSLAESAGDAPALDTDASSPAGGDGPDPGPG